MPKLPEPFYCQSLHHGKIKFALIRFLLPRICKLYSLTIQKPKIRNFAVNFKIFKLFPADSNFFAFNIATMRKKIIKKCIKKVLTLFCVRYVFWKSVYKLLKAVAKTQNIEPNLKKHLSTFKK